MRKLAWDNSFRRAFKKYTKNNQKLRELIFTTLDELAKDPFQAKLKTHKRRKGKMDFYFVRP